MRGMESRDIGVFNCVKNTPTSSLRFGQTSPTIAKPPMHAPIVISVETSQASQPPIFSVKARVFEYAVLLEGTATENQRRDIPPQIIACPVSQTLLKSISFRKM